MSSFAIYNENKGKTGTTGAPGHPIDNKITDYLPKHHLSKIPVTGAYKGGVLVGDKIYCCPAGTNNVLIIDTLTDTVDETTITGLDPTMNNFNGGVLAPNGKIYMAPLTGNAGNFDKLLVVDTKTNTFYYLGIGIAATATNQWWGGCLGLDGKIYFSPQAQPYVLVVDPTNDTLSHVATGETLHGRWSGCIAGADGKIYFSPMNSAFVATLDTTTTPPAFVAEAFDMTGHGGASTGRYNSMVMGIDGVTIYLTPRRSTNITTLNTMTGVITDIAVNGNLVTGTNKWFGGSLARNGVIYMMPYTTTTAPTTSGYILAVNTHDNTTEYIPVTKTATGSWAGSVLANNTKIYGVPATALEVLVIKAGLPSEMDWMLKPTFNKY